MPNDTLRDRWLAGDDAALLADCDVDTYRASGPGGQKRNKTSSAVRLRHRPTSLAVIAEESRSQHENKARALRRLRMAIALNVRLPLFDGWQPPAVFLEYRTPAGRIEISQRNPDYAIVVTIALDCLAHAAGSLRDAAALLDVTTAQLSRFVAKDGKILDAANRLRRDAGLRAISTND